MPGLNLFFKVFASASLAAFALAIFEPTAGYLFIALSFTVAVFYRAILTHFCFVFNVF